MQLKVLFVRKITRRNGLTEMSLPSEIRDQLLSGYLDDALNADERAQVERLLRSDQSFAEELAELKQIRASLKDVFRQDQRVRLGSEFSSRVLDAAVAQARSEGLPEDHPLVRLAEQPASKHSRRTISTRRLFGVMLAVAASLALAIFILASGDPDRPVAQQPAEQPTDPTTDPTGAGQTNADDSLLLAQGESDDTSTAVEDVASNSEATPATDADRFMPNGSPAGEGIASKDAARDLPKAAASNTPPDSSARSVDRLADASNASQSDDEAAMQLTEQMLQGGTPILVYSVQLTDAGRQADALAKAMQQAGISPGVEEAVSEKVAEFVKQDHRLDQGDQQPSILYLQAPTKSLDQLYLNLLSDQQGVESVGLAISLNAPVARLAKVLRVDPTTVRHDGRLLELSQEVGQVQEVASQIDALPFTFGRKRQKATPLQSNGPDQMGQVLVIVR